MLNIDTLTEDLGRLLGDHAEVECEIDNVQAYLDGVAARRKVAPEVGECGWLMLLGLYRASRMSDEATTVAQACAMSSFATTDAIPHVAALLKQGFVRHVEGPATVLGERPVGAPQRRLLLTPKGGKAVAGWLALMHLGARTPIAITTAAIAAALRQLAPTDAASRAG